MKKIVLTGGGTAGHVTPNLALLPKFQKLNYEVSYIGSFEGIEKKLVSDYKLPYYGIPTGKFRRYFSFKNFTDPFRVIKGFFEAKKILKTIQPNIVFSKGGFVSVPVVHAAHALHIPCIIHESDMTPGLANKLCISVATKVCCNFPETLKSLPKNKAVLTGSPIRAELKTGNPKAGKVFCNFQNNLPVILVIGGSLGAATVNKFVREALPTLLQDFQVVHICGKGKIDSSLLETNGYKQFEYVKNELKDIFALSDLVISRAGANAICELLALNKPNILIPLPAECSRGDQILNAHSFEKQGFSMVIDEKILNKDLLVKNALKLYSTKDTYINTMKQNNTFDAIEKIIQLVEDCSKKESLS